jgi:glutamate formiminotransferase / formiminotetrahydrofolate cyclodeaminase
MQRIVECVPNISNGRDPDIYNAVAAEVRHVEHATGGAVRLLGIDPGADTNRTVITFAGEPEAVLEAALKLVAKAVELIDMRAHSGAHPRHGAVDVLPFVPVAGVTMDDCVALARRAGEALGAMGIPVWLYEYAATRDERRNLSELRAGEYEALAGKLGTPEWEPDFGPNEFNESVARTGVCTVGARKFLIAYNINFNTRSTKLVSDIALSIRERGRIARTPEGKFVRDAEGNPVYAPGMFQSCKAMGWYIPEFELAQLTMNLTDWEVTPPHEVFDTVSELAMEKGLRVTGSELVGLIPLAALREAGRYFLSKQSGVCTGVPEAELIRVAVKSMGLDELRPWDSRAQIVEYALEGSAAEALAARPLVNLPLRAFADELASSSPAPGGGSVAALCGALAAGLAAMVPNLTVGKKGYKAVAEEMNAVAAEAQDLKDALLRSIDDDTAAFNKLMDAFRMRRETEAEQAAREAAIMAATRGAVDVPLSVLRRMPPTLELLLTCAQRGNANTLSDALAGAVTALACAIGAHANVLINLKGMEPDDWTAQTRRDADDVLRSVHDLYEAVAGEVVPRLEPGTA